MKKITKSELENQYDKLGAIGVAEWLNVTVPTVYSYLKQAGIPLKGAGAKRKVVIKEN